MNSTFLSRKSEQLTLKSALHIRIYGIKIQPRVALKIRHISPLHAAKKGFLQARRKKDFPAQYWHRHQGNKELPCRLQEYRSDHGVRGRKDQSLEQIQRKMGQANQSALPTQEISCLPAFDCFRREYPAIVP